MPYDKTRQSQKCIVCDSQSNEERHIDKVAVDCSRCGDFLVLRRAEDDFLPLKDKKQRALASHLIRRLQGVRRPTLDWNFFNSLSQRNLPTPAEAGDSLLLFIAECADGSPGKRVGITFSDAKIQAVIGVIDDNDLRWQVDALRSQELLSGVNSVLSVDPLLTSKGWLRVEELKRAHIASSFVFFARKFDNPELDRVFEECLRPAVAQTGFELRIASQRAGLVDAIIEDEIRRCRFLIADLSDDNAGAYWEAGFAEGLGKPVIYVCRASDGVEEKKTHFDTDHRHTVRWDISGLDKTAKKLKAIIRNTLLGDAKQHD
jgi:hypothetical protein